MTIFARFMRAASVSATLAALLCAAPPSWAQSQEKSFADMIGKLKLLPAGKPDSEMLAKAAAAVKHLQDMALPEASAAINEALQLDARNTHLHFLNGFIYHLQARQGDTQKHEMAIEGYQQALRMEPGNWIAQEFLGLSYLDLKQFEQARHAFTDALLLTPDSAVAIHGLMVSSYMTGDPQTACAMADRFSKASSAPHAGYIRSSVAVYASCGQFEKADLMRAEWAKLQRDPADLARLDRRLADWKTVYRKREAADADARNASAPPMLIKAGDFAEPPDAAPPVDASESPSPAEPMAPTPAPAEPPQAIDDGTPRMVLVDVVMVSTQELITTAKGVNLLNALTLQLGSSDSPAYSRGVTNTVSTSEAGTFVDPTKATAIVKRAVTIPALTYSLNIANAGSNLSEVLARPTLAATDGQTSEFFSGTNLNAGVLQAGGVGPPTTLPVDKRFGVKLAVTPGFLPNGMVKLKVEAMRTYLNASSGTGGFAYRLDISETSANANVVMKLGDTLVLSGLSEKETDSSRSGVPGLQDVPGLQYLFSTQRSADYQRSVLILITPRAPIYTDKSGRGPQGGMTDSMKALREKLGFAGKTPSNVASILNHLKSTTLFRDFRQGDVSLERWDRMHSTGDRLRQALDFLYY